MYLYVLGFSKYQHLLKVGISVKPSERIKQLQSVHGECVSVVAYNMGKYYKQAEKMLHLLLEEHNVRVDGDGGTEFFLKECVPDAVRKVVSLCEGVEELISLEDSACVVSSNKPVKQPHLSEFNNKANITSMSGSDSYWFGDEGYKIEAPYQVVSFKEWVTPRSSFNFKQHGRLDITGTDLYFSVLKAVVFENECTTMAFTPYKDFVKFLKQLSAAIDAGDIKYDEAEAWVSEMVDWYERMWECV